MKKTFKMFESIKLHEIPNRHSGILREPSNTRPSLRIIEEDGVRAVIKDFSPNGFIYRNIIGRVLVWRETKAYRRLKGLKGVPTLYRSVDGLALIIEEIKGRNLENLEKETRLSEDFFKELSSLVANVHRRGLVHGDLKRAPNIISGNDGRPYLVDWAASVSKSEFDFFPFNLIYQLLIQDDLNAIVKRQLEHSPESVSPEAKRRYAHRSRAEKLIRAIWEKVGKKILRRIA